MTTMRHDKRATEALMRSADEAVLDEHRALFGTKRPPARAVRAAQAFLDKRDPWDEIKPRKAEP